MSASQITQKPDFQIKARAHPISKKSGPVLALTTALGIIVLAFILSLAAWNFNEHRPRTDVFALVWPESAQSKIREKLAASLRAIASLLRLGGPNGSTREREQVELEIASRLSEANSYEEQATFEGLIYGSHVTNGVKNISTGITEIYLACLSWLREQTASTTTIQAGGNPQELRELSGSLALGMEKLAHRLSLKDFQVPGSTRAEIEALERLVGDGPGDSESSDSGRLETLVQALVRMETRLRSAKEGG
jgi:hypothetical protein